MSKTPEELACEITVAWVAAGGQGQGRPGPADVTRTFVTALAAIVESNYATVNRKSEVNLEKLRQIAANPL